MIIAFFNSEIQLFLRKLVFYFVWGCIILFLMVILQLGKLEHRVYLRKVIKGSKYFVGVLVKARLKL